MKPRLRELRAARVLRAEPNAVGENQIRGGGVGGRSIRADAVASSIAKDVAVKAGNRESVWGRAEKNQRRARNRATTARLRFDVPHRC